jgi:hypothetical protein
MPFWNAIGVLDILTDLVIILLPAYLVWGVQMSFKKKALVVLIFGTRILSDPHPHLMV